VGGGPSLGREFSPPNVDLGYRAPRAPRLARSAPVIVGRTRAVDSIGRRRKRRLVRRRPSTPLDAGSDGGATDGRYSRRVAAHQSLYRKYRPQRFSEVVGQEHVVGALRSSVRDGRVGHAYLFSGPRGTGKTTTARLLAKALNCTSLGDDGDPCGECEICRAIAAGTFLDLFELDAASNRGIENIRDVIESASLGLGPSARTKVYVLDEVHMLTDAAANALLKTLEEAPGHVVFVLATTNPEKVLPTIRSRTQHFEFTLLSNEDLIARLSDLCAREGVTADPEALEILATAGAGSARDAESLLDQALAHGVDHLDAETIRELFGGTAFSARARILEAIAGEDAAGALVGLGELLESGHEPRRVAEDLLAAARDAFLLTAARGRVHVSAPTDEQDHLRDIGEALGNAALVRVIETLGQAITDMRGVEAADPRLVVEVALVRLSRREAGPPIQTVIERIERLERAQGGEPAAPAARAPLPDAPTRRSRPTVGALRRESAVAAAGAPEPDDDSGAVDVTATGDKDAAAATERAGTATGGDAIGMDLDDVIIAWGAIVPELPPATRSAVQNAQPVRFDGDVLVFGVAPELLAAARDRFKREADNVRDALAERLGRRFKFKLEPARELSMSGRNDAERAPNTPGVANGDNDAGRGRANTNGDNDAQRAPAPDVSTGAASDAMEDDEEDMEGGVAVPADVDPVPMTRLRDELGATVVEEVPRD
jgi:DNA polymerase-3 subunit gamma/tau